jgi:murein DD-endopeptidase MepM/ murein hydrolase activator NlpD
MLYPCDAGQSMIFSSYADHQNRPGYRGTLGNDIASYNQKFLQLIASITGTIVEIGYDAGGYGNYLFLENVKYRMQYAHLKSIKSAQNAKVKAGEIIGIMGSTGNSTGVHLHWAVWEKVNSQWQSIDPIGCGMIDALVTPGGKLSPPIAFAVGEIYHVTTSDGLFTHTSPDTKITTRGRLLAKGTTIKVLEREGDMACIEKLWVYMGKDYVSAN